MLKVTNSTHEKVTFNPEDAVGVVDLRSLQYYKIKQGVLQQNLSQNHHIKSAETVCDQYNRLINTLRKEEREANVCGEDKYPWLDDSNERKYISDKEILDKYINLDNSCLTRLGKEKSEKNQSIPKEMSVIQDRITAHG